MCMCCGTVLARIALDFANVDHGRMDILHENRIAGIVRDRRE